MSNSINSKDVQKNSAVSPLYLLKGLLFSIIISFLLMLPFAFICKNFLPDESYVSLSAHIISFISAFFYGLYSAKHISKGGLLNGATSGFLYFLIIFLVSSLLIKKLNFSLDTLIMLIISLAGGSIGGTVGINAFSNSRRR